MDIKFSSAGMTAQTAWAVPVLSGQKLAADLGKLGSAIADKLKQVAQQSIVFKGEKEQFLWIHGLGTKQKPLSVLLYGIGKKTNFNDQLDSLKLGGALLAQAKAHGQTDLHVWAPDFANAALIGLGAQLRAYQFADYKTKGKDILPPVVKAMTLHGENIKIAEKIWPQYAAVASGVYLARDVMNQPPNICTPAGFVKTAQDRMKKLPVTFRVLDKAAIAKLGMGAIQAVSRGNRNDPYVLIAEYNGTVTKTVAKTKKTKSSPVALVGKGVTFDTGGYNIKPGVSAGWTMGDMKYDMGGAAAVMGTVLALAQGKVPVHVVGIVGLTENMVDEDAYLPSEIITTLSGQTVEVIDTDAEGRLVLADLLTYVQQHYKPKAILDIATLTGAVVVALGMDYAGVLGHDDAMVEAVMQSGLNTGEKCWRLPIDAAPAHTLKSSIADLVNVDISRLAGASFAAHFLSHFVEKDVPWTHIDIAAMMRVKGDTMLCPAGAMGFGVRLLTDYITHNHANG
jgi:leucyl aminopeptidase